MFWSGTKLEQNIKSIFSPFDAKNIDCAAYTLHVGRELYISSDGDSSEAQLGRQLNRSEQFSIPAGQFAFLLTEEVLSIPNHVMALINVKSSIKLRGLINVSGFHVDPGYNGKLVISVFNAGPVPIILRAGDPCFLIWLADLDGDVGQYYYKKQGFTQISSDLISKVPTRNTSIQTLSRDVNLLRNKTDLVFNIVLGVGIPFFIAVLVAVIQMLAQKWYENRPNLPSEVFTDYFLTYIGSAITVVLIIFFINRRNNR